MLASFILFHAIFYFEERTKEASDRVIVTNKEVEIRYVIPTSLSSEHLRFCHLRLDYFHCASRLQALSPSGLD